MKAQRSDLCFMRFKIKDWSVTKKVSNLLLLGAGGHVT